MITNTNSNQNYSILAQQIVKDTIIDAAESFACVFVDMINDDDDNTFNKSSIEESFQEYITQTTPEMLDEVFEELKAKAFQYWYQTQVEPKLKSIVFGDDDKVSDFVVTLNNI